MITTRGTDRNTGFLLASGGRSGDQIPQQRDDEDRKAKRRRPRDRRGHAFQARRRHRDREERHERDSRAELGDRSQPYGSSCPELQRLLAAA